MPLPWKSPYLRSFLVPLVHITIDVDTENRSISGINELTELVGHGSDSTIMLGSLSYILLYEKSSE